MSYYRVNGKRSDWTKHFETRNKFESEKSEYSVIRVVTEANKNIINIYESDFETLSYMGVNNAVWSEGYAG